MASSPAGYNNNANVVSPTYDPRSQAPPAPTRPGIIVDRRRNPKYFVDDFLYSVQLDQERLKCYYCCHTIPFCCCNQDKLANHTWMDIYTSGVEIGRPTGCLCIAKPARGVKVHYDDFEVFGKPPIVGQCCMEPTPYLCTNCCDCYGETLVMPGECTCRLCPSWSVGLGSECTTCTVAPFCAQWCCPISIMYGLKDGEAEKAAGIITAARSIYLNAYTRGTAADMSVWQHPAVVAANAAMPAAYNGHPSPAIVYANATTTASPYEQQQAYPTRGVNEPYNATNANPVAMSPAPAVVAAPPLRKTGSFRPRSSSASVAGDATPRATFRLPDGDWRFDNDSRMYWSDEQQLYLRTTDGHFYDPHSTQWYNPDDGTWYHGN